MCKVDANEQQKDPDVEIRNPGYVYRKDVGDDGTEDDARDDTDDFAHGGRARSWGVEAFCLGSVGMETPQTSLYLLDVGWAWESLPSFWTEVRSLASLA